MLGERADIQLLNLMSRSLKSYAPFSHLEPSDLVPRKRLKPLIQELLLIYVRQDCITMLSCSSGAFDGKSFCYHSGHASFPTQV